MANSIEMCKEYVNNQVEHLNMFARNLLCADFLVRKPDVKGNVISYDRYSFANYVMGTVSNGSVSQKDFTCERVNKTLTQDRGDSLTLDIKDKLEGQIADGIAGLYNFYQVKVKVPTLDKYAFGKFAEVGGDEQIVVTGSLTSANILGAIVDAKKPLKNKRIDTKECVLFISVSANALLEQATLGQARIHMGNWAGKLDAQVRMFDEMKLIEVPDDTLGCAFIIAHPLSASVIDVLGIVELYERVPGKPGTAQVDVRDHFDAWVEPSGGEGIVVALEKPRAVTLPADATFATSTVIKISGIEKGAKVYYTDDGSTPTSSSTEYNATTGIALSATKTIKAVAIINSVASEVASGTYTKA